MNKYETSMRFRVIMFILTAFMISFAFVHSAMPSEVSSNESAGVLGVFQSFLNSLGFDIKLSHHFIRKLAHFTEYTAIGMLLLSCAYSFNRIKPYKYYAQVLFFGLFTAVCDEAIQLNVEGRAGMITDVLLDFSGVITGAVIMLVTYIIYIRAKKIGD